MVQKSQIVRLAEEKVDFIDYFNKYVAGESVVQGHRQYISPIQIGGATICPLHAETDASFKVFKKNDLVLFHCFGCDCGGTVVDLFRRIEIQKRGITYSKDDAAKNLLRLYGFDVDIEEVVKEVDPLKEALEKVRGFSDGNINKTFNIGVFKRENNRINEMVVPLRKKRYADLDRMASAYVLINNEGD